MIFQREDAQSLRGVLRVFDRHLPGGTIQLTANGGDVAAQIQQSGSNAILSQHGVRPAGGKALSHRAQVHFHACLLKSGRGGGLIHNEGFAVHQRHSVGQSLS